EARHLPQSRQREDLAVVGLPEIDWATERTLGLVALSGAAGTEGYFPPAKAGPDGMPQRAHARHDEVLHGVATAREDWVAGLEDHADHLSLRPRREPQRVDHET